LIEEAADDGRGMGALLLAVEQREVALQESGDAVAAAPDIVGRDRGVGEQGLGVGVVQEGASSQTLLNIMVNAT